MRKFIALLALSVYLLQGLVFFSIQPAYAVVGTSREARWIDIGTLEYEGTIFRETKIDTNWHFIEVLPQPPDPADSCPDEIKDLNYDPDKDPGSLPSDTQVNLQKRRNSPGNQCTNDGGEIPLTLINQAGAEISFKWLDQQSIVSPDGKRRYVYTETTRTHERKDSAENICVDTIEVSPDKSTGTLIVRKTRKANDLSSRERTEDLRSDYGGYSFVERITYEREENDGKCIVSKAVTGIRLGDVPKALLTPAPGMDYEQEDPYNEEDAKDLNLKDSTTCGAKNGACCSDVFRVPNPEIKLPRWGGVGSIINIILSPIRKIISLAWVGLASTVGSGVHYFKGNTPCQEGLKQFQQGNTCTCVPRETFSVVSLCKSIKDPAENRECVNCNSHGIWTSIGCVDFRLERFIGQKLFGIGVSTAGVFSLLCIIYSAFLLQISRTDPERIKKAREYLTNCILGLIIVIFSILILRLIGVTILQIPGFS